MVYGGDGLARLPSADSGRSQAVFVPFVLSGEKIEASLTEQKSSFARARANSVLEKSPHRVEPSCPYFARCGGCDYQHASYPHQLEIKRDILRENLQRIARLELSSDIQLHPSPPWNYRNRSRLQVRALPEFSAGYFKRGSREVLAVEQCPISSPLINRGIAALWDLGRTGKLPAGIEEVEFFANAEDTRLLIELSCVPNLHRKQARACAEEFAASLAEIAGVTAFRHSGKGAPEPLVTVGDSSLNYQIGNASYRVSAGSFFQTNRFLVEELVQIVADGRSGDLVLDLYAGVGLFSTALTNFRHIISVESSQTSTADLTNNVPAHAKTVCDSAEHFLTGIGEAQVGKRGALPHRLATPDFIVVDPPRNGLGARVTGALAALQAGRITYVSCDPATLARDLVPLLAAGYRVGEVHLVDLFPQTFHLETIVQLHRS